MSEITCKPADNPVFRSDNLDNSPAIRSHVGGSAQPLHRHRTTSLDSGITVAALDSRWRDIEQLWSTIPNGKMVRGTLLDSDSLDLAEQVDRNIERFIGTVKVPLGIAGPLQVKGSHASGDYLVPLATTEATLVASYHRGARLISASGGCTAMLLESALNRSPGLRFASLVEVKHFLQWLESRKETLAGIAMSTTRFGRLMDLRTTVEGNQVYLDLVYSTADAAGQNMVTIATEAILQYLLEHTPVKPRSAYVEANFSGDKKASARVLASVRGKRVSAEIVVPAARVQQILNTTAGAMVDYWYMGAMGGVMSATMGVQGHYANGLAALFLACGQDIACVAEAAVGITRLELTGTGDLYAAVTLPSLVVGTVGGGTLLPSQNSCLQILGLAGSGHAAALAEVCGALALAGELSIIGALSAREFTRAHQRHARVNKLPVPGGKP